MRFVDRLWLVLLPLCLFFLPGQLGRHFWPPASHLLGLRIDYLSPTLYFTDLLVFALVILSLFIKPLKIDLTKTRILSLIVLAVFLVANWAVSENSSIFIYTFTRLVLVGLFFGVVWRFNRQIVRLLPAVIPPLVVLQLGLALSQVVAGGSIGGLFYWLGERSFTVDLPGIARSDYFGRVLVRAYGTFSHPNSLAGFIGVVFFLLLTGNKLGKTQVVFLVLSVFVVVLTGSRTASLALTVLVAVYFLNRQKLSRRFHFLLTSLICLAAIFIGVGLSDPVSASVMLRWQLVQIASQIIRAHPLFGVGLGNFLPALAGQVSQNGFYFLQPVHTIYLLIITEIGLIGFFGLVVGIGLYLARDRHFQPSNPFVWPLAYILFTGLFDHYWLTLVQNQYLFALVLGLYFSSSRQKDQSLDGDT